MPSRHRIFYALRKLRNRLNVIQRLIHRQLTQHDDLCDTQRGLAVRGIQHGGEIVEHLGDRTQGLTGIGLQRFGVVTGLARYMGSATRADAMI